MSTCRVFSCVVGRGCLLRPMCSLGKTLLAFALLHFVLQGQTCLLLQAALDFLLCIAVPCDEKDIFFRCQLQKVLQVFKEPLNFSFFSITGWGIDLAYYDTEWFALEMNRDHFVTLRLHPSTSFWTLLLTIRATQFHLRDSCPQQQIEWPSELNLPIPVHFGSLILKMSMFTLAISCLITSIWLDSLT